VKSEVDASTIRLQLAKAQDDAHRLGLLSAENDQMVRLLESTSLHQLPLKPVNALAGEANARVVWDDDRGLMLLANNLPELPDKRVFQLWILRKGTPSIVSAGVVQVDSRGRGTVFVPPGADLNAMAGVVVTDEPAGGSVSSRGSQVLLGKP
jgi:anti-sigma-K factor RskA